MHSCESTFCLFVVSKSKRIGSLGVTDSHSAHSKHSMKATSSTTSRIPNINQSSRNSKARGMKRYDVNDKNNSEKMTSENKKQQNFDKNKLLKNRERKKSKRILDQERFDSVSNIGKEQLITDTGSIHDRVKSPTANDPRPKSRGKDSPAIENVVTERPGSLRTSVLRRQWNQSHGGNGSTVPLTSQLLKDFTNSPEGKQSY